MKDAIKKFLNNNKDWKLVKIVKPSEKTKKRLNLPDDMRYYVEINVKTGEVRCDCMGYLTHGHCKHAKEIEDFIKSALNKQKEK